MPSNTIMCDGSRIIRQRQIDVRCEIDRRGFHLKAVASKSGIPYPTLLSYFPADANAQPAQIPAGALFAIAYSDALPADILSMFAPAGWAIVKLPEDLDHDEFEDLCRDYLNTKGNAHHKDSPAGREVSECEREALAARVVRLRGAA